MKRISIFSWSYAKMEYFYFLFIVLSINVKKKGNFNRALSQILFEAICEHLKVVKK